MTPTGTSKAEQVFDSLYKSIGGSGSNPDVAQFKTHLSNVPTDQMINARSQWRSMIETLAQESNPPQNIVEEVALFGEELVNRLQRASTGART